jgi:hypothetical protein|tara:strand:- start:1049 stop:1234 length:186 start_codon:yes stop_codon:yes gene_type:complete
MKLHYNKKYNFVKGLTVTEIVTFVYITLLGITALAGIVAIFSTAVTDPSAFSAFDSTGFHM